MIGVKGGPVQLVLAQRSDAQLIHGLKREAFMPLYEIYRDDETDPLILLLRQNKHRRNQICILLTHNPHPADHPTLINYQPVIRILLCQLTHHLIHRIHNRIGSAVLEQLFQMYPETFCWRLVTIREEERNCHLYEKMGFCNTLSARKVSGNMTLIGYERFFKESSGEG